MNLNLVPASEEVKRFEEHLNKAMQRADTYQAYQEYKQILNGMMTFNKPHCWEVL